MRTCGESAHVCGMSVCFLSCVWVCFESPELEFKAGQPGRSREALQPSSPAPFLMTDEAIRCRDCSQVFLFEAASQVYFAENGSVVFWAQPKAVQSAARKREHLTPSRLHAHPTPLLDG